MKYYFAPMEGITSYIYRSAHHQLFQSPDKYFTPFIAPNQSKSLSSREKNDILPEHNRGIFLIPQILTNNSDDFISTCQKLKEFGYEEVNLNLGCPSGTVVSKGRGAGFLADPKRLDAFLAEIFEHGDVKISIKTRLGIAQEEEFYPLLDIFNQYPLTELIIHPRLQKDLYKHEVRMELYQYATTHSKNALCYNGDIFTTADVDKFTEEAPGEQRLMIGRGLLSNPAFLDCLCGKSLKQERLKEFHDIVCGEYQQILSGERNVLFKMKELWFYMIRLFPDGVAAGKKIRKSQRLMEYLQIVDELFKEHEVVIPKQMHF